MKKTIFLIAVTLLGLTACNKQIDLPVSRQQVPENALVTLEFSVPVPAETKADMAATPDLSASRLFVLVFNTSTGALLEAPEAKLFEKAAGNGVANKAAYKVDVTMGSTPRALHFLVDAPMHEVPTGNVDETHLGYADNPVMLGDTEAMVWQKLYTSNKQAAYWQRIPLPNGIHAYTYLGGEPVYYHENAQGQIPALQTYDDNGTADLSDDSYVDNHNNTVYQGDYINRLGDKIVDGTGFFACDEVSERIATVPLVRNFARIKLSSSAEGLTLTKAVLANTPKYGYLAPYNAAGNEFVTNYTTITNGALALNSTTVRNSGYTAPVPLGEIDTVCPAESACIPANNGVVELFTYERSVPTADATCVLVCFNNSKWFKIEITDDTGSYIPVYRGFDYPMEIKSITGSDGYGSITDAFNNVAFGDVSGSPETQTLTQVADGKGLNLWVDYIDYTHIGDATNVNLRYKFWHDTDGNKSSSVTATVTHKTTAHAVTDADDVLEGQPYSGTDTQDQEDGWYYVSVPLGATGDNIKRSVVRISGTYDNKKLYRDVTFSVYPTQTMTLAVEPLPSDGVEEETTLTITLPSQLGFSMFPLVLKIEALNDNLNPTTAETNLPVNYGETLFTGVDGFTKTGNAFYFVKTINFSEYNAETGSSYEVHLKTTKASGNATTILVVDDKGRFNKATTTLTVN